MSLEAPGGDLTGLESQKLQQQTPAVSQLILASASPRRQDLLRNAGFCFIVDPADIDESQHPPGLSPDQLVVYLAQAKANSVAERYPTQVVLAADTLVALGTRILGKPANAADARVMLSALSGTSHHVLTGVAVRVLSKTHVLCVRSDVHMRPLSDAEIAGYVAGGQWRGKAGGYGIQDPDPFVSRIAGSETNIVGLPMDETCSLLAAVGIIPDPRDS